MGGGFVVLDSVTLHTSRTIPYIMRFIPNTKGDGRLIYIYWRRM